jgi:hypothetical protein
MERSEGRVAPAVVADNSRGATRKRIETKEICPINMHKGGLTGRDGSTGKSNMGLNDVQTTSPPGRIVGVGKQSRTTTILRLSYLLLLLHDTR